MLGMNVSEWLHCPLSGGHCGHKEANIPDWHRPQMDPKRTLHVHTEGCPLAPKKKR